MVHAHSGRRAEKRAGGSTMERRRPAGRVGALAMGAALGIAGIASSAGASARPHWHNTAFAGTVASVSGSGFTLTKGSETVTVVVGSGTAYFDRAVSSASLIDVIVGERVRAAGSAAATDTLDAARVVIAPAQHVLVSGTVGTVGTSSFTLIEGPRTLTINVDPTTTYVDHGVASPSLSDVTSGAPAQVLGALTGQATIEAERVVVEPADVVLFSGTVATVSTSGFTATSGSSTVTVVVGTSTTFIDPGVASPGLSNLTGGSVVQVLGTENPDHSLAAQRVWIGTHTHTLVSGTISHISTSSFTLISGVRTLTVSVTPDTTYSVPGDSGASLNDLSSGDKVRVLALIETGPSLVALHVSVLPLPRVLFTGTVGTVSTSSFTVSHGVRMATVDVSSSTSYRDRADSSPSFADVTAGALVVVSGSVATTGTIAANSITVLSPRHTVGDGTVASVGTSSFTISSGVHILAVTVSGSTTYVDALDPTPGFSDVVVGARVHVAGTVSTSGTLDAQNVRIVPVAPRRATGVVGSLLANGFTMTSSSTTIIVAVSASTTYREHGVLDPGLSSVAVGDTVAVTGLSGGTDVIDATSVAISPPPPITVNGTVANIATTSFTVTSGISTVTVDVSASTTYSTGSTSGIFSALAVGDRVEATGTATSNHVLDATNVEYSAPSSITVAGTVGTVGAASFTVSSGAATVAVDVSAMTTYADAADPTPSYADVTTGTRVTVTGAESSGTLDASHVSVTTPAGLNASGTVASVGTNTFTITSGVATITVNVSSSTTYHDASASSPGFADVVTGAHVQVQGTEDASHDLDAQKVTIAS